MALYAATGWCASWDDAIIRSCAAHRDSGIEFEMAPISKQDEAPPRRPPPNYFSRRVQVRLLVLVCAFMLVVFLMEESRKPKYYAWMWGDEVERVEPVESVDTRIGPPANPSPGPADAIRTGGPAYDAETLADASDQRSDPLERAAVDAWGRMLGELGREQRREFNRVLWLRREKRLPDTEQLQILSQAISVLGESLQEYVARGRETLSANGQLSPNDQLPEDEIAAWQGVLDRLEQSWKVKWKPALNGLFEYPDPNPDHVAAIVEIQSLVDELDLAAIRDGAVARPSEWNAWFRFIERLRATSPDELEQQSIGVVSFLQLHKQPRAYRGKVVTIRGQVRLGYRVSAPNNIYGVKQYSLLWLKPRGGPNTLVAVYCLETPGLPKLKHKDLDRGVTELDHEVEITGYFFKKWAYRSRDGIRTAPKILARSAVVESAPGWQTVTPPSNQLLTLVVLGAVLGGLVIGIAFFQLNQWPSRIGRFLAKTARPLDALDPSQVSQGVKHELRRLESIAEEGDQLSGSHPHAASDLGARDNDANRS